MLLTGEVAISGGEESLVVETGDTLLIAEGAYLSVEPGATLKCPAGISCIGVSNLPWVDCGALVTLETDDELILYGSVADLEADVKNLPCEVNSVELFYAEPGASYITLDFDLPFVWVFYSGTNLEIAPHVRLAADYLYVEGDCIWYNEDSIRDVAGGEITGLYPRLLARAVFHDETGFHEQLDMQMGGGYEFDRIYRDELSAFYAQYFDGYQWVFTPVDVTALTVDDDASFSLVSLAGLGLDAPAHYGAYCADAWNVEGAIQANNVDGNGLNLGYGLACYTGPVNFFSEPMYEEWCAIDAYGGGVSTLTGRTIYAASYLAEENLQNLDWYAVDYVTGREMPLQAVAHFERMEENDQTVWSINVPAEVICDYPDGFAIGVSGRAHDDGNAWDFGTELDIYPQEALGWTAENVGDDLAMDMFGILQDYVSVPVGGSVTGWVYKTYYNEDEGAG